MYILGIESSCDDTSIGIIYNDEIIINVTYSHIAQNARFGGVVPEVSAREHVNNIDNVLKEVLTKANIKIEDIELIGVTTCPGLQGSLLVGAYFAYSLSKIFNIPIMPVHHLEAHLLVSNPVFPCDAFILSGGHTMLVRLHNFFHYEVIGETLDDSVGEYLDKVGRKLNLPFPAGIHIEKYFDSNISNSPLSTPMKNSPNFSFSGLKTQTINKIPLYSLNELCSFMLITIGDILEEKITKYTKFPIIMGGGVASNSYIRKRLSSYNITFPPKELCTDNGVMIAKAAKYYKDHNLQLNDFNILPNYSLENWKQKFKKNIT